jgi:hypothetical protein
MLGLEDNFEYVSKNNTKFHMDNNENNFIKHQHHKIFTPFLNPYFTISS